MLVVVIYGIGIGVPDNGGMNIRQKIESLQVEVKTSCKCLHCVYEVVNKAAASKLLEDYKGYRWTLGKWGIKDLPGLDDEQKRAAHMTLLMDCEKSI